MLTTPVVEVWSDLHQSLTADASASLRKVINIEAVRTSIDNIVGTTPGERVFLPEFALGLKNLLFEPINKNLLSRFSDEIKNKVEAWDNRVNIVGVDFNADTDNNYVEITVRFNVRSYTEIFTHTVTVTQ